MIPEDDLVFADLLIARCGGTLQLMPSRGGAHEL
jgi:hypothetical protein